MRAIVSFGVLVVASLLALETSAALDKVVCYYGSWAVYRPGDGKYDVENIDPHGCTHAIFGFLGIDPAGNIVIKDPHNEINMGAFIRFNALKQVNPNLKTLVAIGGWNEGSKNFSDVSASWEMRRRTIDGAVSLLREYGFDGFDLDWEYPGDRGGVPQDKANFATWVREFREEFNKHGFLLTAAVGATQARIDESYDVPALNEALDFVNIMTYDFHGAFDPITGHNAPMQPAPAVISSVEAWINSGLSPHKLIMGVPSYGRTFTLADPGNPSIGVGITGPGRPGPYTREEGNLGYNEICEYINAGGWSLQYDADQQVPYMYQGDQWVTYDNPDSIAIKVNYAKSRGVGGIMLWSYETDDFHGKCGERNPILATINRNRF